MAQQAWLSFQPFVNRMAGALRDRSLEDYGF